jgi:hypothetical protein
LAQVIRRLRRVVNHLENTTPRNAKARHEGGSSTPAEAEKLGIRDSSQFPEIQAARQAKTLFSLSGGFVPIFGPSAAGCNRKEQSHA